MVRPKQDIVDNTPLDEKFEMYEGALKKAQSRFDRAKELYVAGEMHREHYLQEKEKLDSAKVPIPEKGLDAIVTLIKNMRAQLSAW